MARLFRELPHLGLSLLIGYEAQALSVKDAERLAQAGAAWRWDRAQRSVERLRASKDPARVASIRWRRDACGDALEAALGRWASA